MSTTDPTDRPTSGHSDDRDTDPGTAPEITVYWRPGCPFCGSLFRQLDQAEVAYRRVNIWDDEIGAGIVRSIARGNETVPTVVVGDVGMVNPSVTQILAVAGNH